MYVAQALIKEKADPKQRDAHGTPVLHKAAERGGERMIEILVGAGADVESIDTSSRSTALHAAVRAGNAATVKALVKRVCLDWLDRWNRSALHWGVFHGHAEICRLLLSGRASLEGTVGERGGRFLITSTPCGVLPQRVSKQLATFMTPMQLAKERFPEGGPVTELLCSWPSSTQDVIGPGETNST